MAVRQLKDGRWMVQGRKGFFPNEPQRTRKMFGRGTEAERNAREFNAQIVNERAPLPPAGPTFAQLALDYLENKRRNDEPTEDIADRLETVIHPYIGNRVALRLTFADMDKFVDARKAHDVKNSTIQRELTIIKAVLNWATNKHQPALLPVNPIANYRGPQVVTKKIMPPTPQEIGKIWAVAADHLKRAITLSWYIGLRPGAVELLALTWASVRLPSNEEAGYIRINSAHKGGPEHRDVPIHADLLPHLLAWKSADGETGHLIQYHGKPIKSLKTAWRNAIKSAGIDRKLRPYSMRHAFITSALESGADIGGLSEVVGSRPETLRKHYQHVSGDLQRRLVNLVPAMVPPKDEREQKPS